MTCQYPQPPKSVCFVENSLFFNQLNISHADFPCVLGSDVGQVARSTNPITLYISVNITPRNLYSNPPNEGDDSPAEEATIISGGNQFAAPEHPLPLPHHQPVETGNAMPQSREEVSPTGTENPRIALDQIDEAMKRVVNTTRPTRNLHSSPPANIPPSIASEDDDSHAKEATTIPEDNQPHVPKHPLPLSHRQPAKTGNVMPAQSRESPTSSENPHLTLNRADESMMRIVNVTPPNPNNRPTSTPNDDEHNEHSPANEVTTIPERNQFPAPEHLSPLLHNQPVKTGNIIPQSPEQVSASLTSTSTKNPRLALDRADEAVKRIIPSNTWEGAVGRVKWVMDTLSPVAEVRVISF